MTVFFLKRLWSGAFTLFAIFTLTFFIMKSVPGGPFDSEKALPTEVKINLEKKFYLNEPLFKQYWRSFTNTLRGDFGPSYRYLGTRSVNEIIRETLPVSVELGFYSLVMAIVLGIPLGVLAAYKKKTWLDFSSQFIAASGISLPNYLVASILILIFSIQLGLFSPALWEAWDSKVLPVITLGLRPMALLARLTRASLSEILTQDYIRTAHAKGLSMTAILFKHAMKNALIPLITVLGPLVAAILTGSFVVEVIFAIPGMGRYFVSAVLDRDYTLIMGMTLTYGVFVVVTNFLVDIAYRWADPRIELNG